MTLFQFMSDSPVTSILIVLIIAQALESTIKGLFGANKEKEEKE
jgi:hypothetical protein